MELLISGKPELPPVLLLPPAGMAPAELFRRLQPLEKHYRLLSPRWDGPAEELEAALRREGAERLWGAYGLREGATRLLELLSRGEVPVRTAVTEGPFVLPATSLRDTPGRVVCWKGGKDKKAKKAWKALKEDLPDLRSLTLGKLKAGQDYLSLRPDKMAKRLESTFGPGRAVQLTDTLPQPPMTVWRLLYARPAGPGAGRLTQTQPLCRDDERRTQLLEGRAGPLSLWSHRIRLEPLGSEQTVCVDQVELDAGKLTPVAAALARLYLRREQKRRRALLRRDK